jgi:molecular chaperone GrpE
MIVSSNQDEDSKPEVDPAELSNQELHDQLAALQQREIELKKNCDDLLDALRRCKADLANARKDHARELIDTTRRASVSVIKNLIPVLGNFNIAASAITDKECRDGVVMIYKSLLDSLGVEVIRPSAGDKFNSSEHQAVAEVESESAVGTIAELLTEGYKFGGAVLNAAQVSISTRTDKQ